MTVCIGTLNGIKVYRSITDRSLLECSWAKQKLILGGDNELPAFVVEPDYAVAAYIAAGFSEVQSGTPWPAYLIEYQVQRFNKGFKSYWHLNDAYYFVHNAHTDTNPWPFRHETCQYVEVEDWILHSLGEYLYHTLPELVTDERLLDRDLPKPDRQFNVRPHIGLY